MNDRVPVLVIVDEGYFGHETLQEELGPEFDVHFATSAAEAHAALGPALDWPLVLAPRALDPEPGDALLAALARERHAFVGVLMLDDEAAGVPPHERLAEGVHAIVRRPLRPGMLRLHLQAAAAQRAQVRRAARVGRDLTVDLARLRDGLRHDLRGQLQSVVGLASLVLELERPRRAPDDEVLDFVARIMAAGDRLTRFVDALGDWLNASRRPLEPAAVDLGELLVEVVAKVRTHCADPAALAIEPADPVALTARVRADPRMLALALEVLIERALALSGRALVRLERGGEGCTLSVSDVAPMTLPAAQRPKAFDLFERVAGGDGLGLAIVQKVAERHGLEARLEPLAEGGHAARLTWPWGS